MDGPYSVEMFTRELGVLEIGFIHGERDKDVLVFSTTSETRSCLENGISMAEQVVEVYRKKNWQDKDVTRIRTSIAKIRKFLAQNTQ